MPRRNWRTDWTENRHENWRDRDRYYGASEYGGDWTTSAPLTSRDYYRGAWRPGQYVRRYGKPRYEKIFDGETRRFFGVTPKGYTRSDDRIYEDVCDRLTQDPMLDPSDIEILVKDGEVTLEGNVEDRSDKYRAEDIADSVLGVKNVINRLRVDRSRQIAATATTDEETTPSDQTENQMRRTSSTRTETK